MSRKRNAADRKAIVLARSAGADPDWERYLERHGFVVITLPVIETIPVHASVRLRKIIARLSAFDWIIFTSAAGPRFMKVLARCMRVPLPPFARMPRIATVGKATSSVLRNIGYRPAFMPSHPDGKSLARELRIAPGNSILLLRADIASKDAPDILRKRGARVTDAALYKTKVIKKPAPVRFKEKLMSGAVCLIVFTSPSAVRGFKARTRGAAFRIARGIPAIALGKTTSEALREEGFEKIRIARGATIKDVGRVLK